MEELDALLVLNAVNGLGNSRISKLIEYFGSAKEAVLAKEKDLRCLSSIPASVVENILNFPKDNFLKNEYNLILHNKVEVIGLHDDRYPSLLKEISDRPIVLYAKGNVSVLNELSVAVVGSRKATIYGTSIAYQFSVKLAEMNINVVSGMARGIDTSAHRGALQALGVTVAVLGCGLSRIYPPENKSLMDKISVSGVVLSEFQMNTEPFSYNFPRRNRIISGLSSGVVVIEAAQRSGALITADFALEQGREVYAVPGKIGVATSKGVNDLIKQGAKLITCTEDVIEDLAIEICISVKKDDKLEKDPVNVYALDGLNSFEKNIMSKLGKIPMYIDELIIACDTNAADISSTLLNLELKKLIDHLPGKYFTIKQ